MAAKKRRGKVGKSNKRKFGGNVPASSRQDVPVSPPLDVHELVQEFTEAADELLSDRGIEAVSKQELSTIVQKAVLVALRNRKREYAQIIELERLVRQETSYRRLRERLPSWLRVVGLRRIDVLDVNTKDWFAVLNPDGGDCARVVHPAYVDAGTGALVQNGQVKLDDHSNHSKSNKCILLAELTGATEDGSGFLKGD